MPHLMKRSLEYSAAILYTPLLYKLCEMHTEYYFTVVDMAAGGHPCMEIHTNTKAEQDVWKGSRHRV